MAVVVYLAFVGFAVVLLSGRGGVWQKHEEETIYEADRRSESHKTDPFFQERLGEGFHGGGQGPGL